MIAARRLLAVLPSARVQIEQARVRLEQLAGAVGEPEGGGEEDVGSGATLDEIERELVSPRAALVVEHPLRRRRAMVDVARVDVRAGVEEQVDDRARPREVEWRLPVAAALVYPRGIFRDEAFEELRSVEVRGCAGVGNGTGGDQSIGRRAHRGVQSVEPARPPLTAPVRVRAELEEHIHHLDVVRVRDDRRRIEVEDRVVDALAELRVLLKHAPHRARIATSKRVVQALLGRSPVIRVGVDVLLERRPAREPVLAREGELRIGERDLFLVGEHGTNARLCFGLACGERLQQLLRLLLLLCEVRMCRERPAER